MAEAFRSAAVTAGLGQHLMPTFDLMQTVQRRLTSASADAWTGHLGRTAVPNLSLLAQDWTERVGILSQVPDGLGMSLSWLAEVNDEPVVMTAALLELVEESLLRVLAEDEIVCAICEGPMHSVKASLSLLGRRRGLRLKRRVFPVCPTCDAALARPIRRTSVGRILFVKDFLTRLFAVVCRSFRASCSQTRGRKVGASEQLRRVAERRGLRDLSESGARVSRRAPCSSSVADCCAQAPPIARRARIACYARSVTTQELMQAVLALPKADLEELREAIDAHLEAPLEASPELLALIRKRSADFDNGVPGIPSDEVFARLRGR